MAPKLQPKPDTAAERMPPAEDPYLQERNALLKDVPYSTVQKAWFTLAHILPDDGAVIADMGCGDGAMAYAMAVLNPKIKVIAVDKSKREINKAREIWKRPNLEFKAAEASSEMFEHDSLDAIINSYILHEVYSGSRYNERIVSDTLRRHFRMLKVGGTMFIRDFARPPPEEFVLMEMPDEPSRGNDLKDLSEADLLVWYSQHARPRQDPGCGGFFLEELPARFPRTRLFRLPYKWAYEFIMRKDDRSHWETQLPMEYTFYTERGFRKELRALGARLVYSAPYWDEDIIEKKFEGHFRLYDNRMNPLGNPPTCYIAVAQKMSERKSLYIEERRPSTADDSSLRIYAMRDERNGNIVDVVTRNMEIAEILPYTIAENGRLKIFLHDGVARSVATAVARSGTALDGKRWSGHMIEPLALDLQNVLEMGEIDAPATVRFSRDYLGFKPKTGAVLEHGPDYYPAPDFIDERIHTYYLNVESPQREITPKHVLGNSGRFQARGRVREIDAQAALDAISVGRIPNARLELQILSLFQHLNMQAENWTEKKIQFERGKIYNPLPLRKLLQSLRDDSVPFKEIKGTAGDLRRINSTFVEEGQSQGAITGLTSQDVHFVISDTKTVNVAVVLPLTSNEKGEVHAGFMLEHLPVPQRHEGKATTISAPSFNLPPEITNMKMAKKYIADKFNVAPENVFKLGESYYSHVGLTPQKIYPFGIAVPPGKMPYTNTQFIPIRWYLLLWSSLSRSPHFMLTLARAYRYLHGDIKLQFKRDVKHILEERFAAAQPDWSIPASYSSVPAQKEPQAPQIAVPEPANDAEAKFEPVPPPAPAMLAPEPEQIPDDPEMEEAIRAIEEDRDHNQPRPEKW